MEKGSIAHFEQFHFFPQCFPKAVFLSINGEMVNTLKTKTSGNIVEKGKIAQNEQFHLFPQCFLMQSVSSNPLTHYQTTNFRLFQTERVCRRQFQI